MRFYVSHSIRGAKGEAATPTDTKKNCDKIIQVCKIIQEALPSVDLYVPAEHEDFVSIVFYDGYLSEQQVLEIDCKIIDNCDGVIIYCPPDDPICGGRTIEREHAIATSKPVLIFQTSGEAISWLTQQIMRG